MLNPLLKGKIIQCHIDKWDPDSFVVGRLWYSDDTWLVMQNISPSGRWNGVALYQMVDLVRVTVQSEYLKRTKKLIRLRKESAPQVVAISGCALTAVLRDAMQQSTFLSFELWQSGGRDVSGIVEDVTDQVVRVRQIDEYGVADGYSFISMEAISRCYVDDEEAKCLQMLVNG